MKPEEQKNILISFIIIGIIILIIDYNRNGSLNVKINITPLQLLGIVSIFTGLVLNSQSMCQLQKFT